jgi:hypothetical protein
MQDQNRVNIKNTDAPAGCDVLRRRVKTGISLHQNSLSGDLKIAAWFSDCLGALLTHLI